MWENVIPFPQRREGGDESLEDLKLGPVGRRIREFYEFVPPPDSGFPLGDSEDNELTLVFVPRPDKWHERVRKRILLETLQSEMVAVSDLEWRGRMYRVLRVLNAEIIICTSRPKQVGRLFIKLAVEEIV